MRFILTVLFILFLRISFCHAQEVKRSIKLVKESAKIDSFIVSIIHMPKKMKPLKDDSCLLIIMDKNKDCCSSIEGIPTLEKHNRILGLGNFQDNKKLGYFEFEGYLVFIYDDNSKRDFFKFQSSKHEFIFIKATPKEYLFSSRNYLSWAIFFYNDSLNYGVH